MPRPTAAEPVNFIVDMVTNDGASFSATAVSTIEGGSDYTFLTLQLFNGDDVAIGTPVSVEQISKGVFVTLTTPSRTTVIIPPLTIVRK